MGEAAIDAVVWELYISLHFFPNDRNPPAALLTDIRTDERSESILMSRSDREDEYAIQVC